LQQLEALVDGRAQAQLADEGVGGTDARADASNFHQFVMAGDDFGQKIETVARKVRCS
jgi:hypothetical protein